jgi:hypothetical protein
MSPTYHVTHQSYNMDCFFLKGVTNKTTRYGLARLFHPSDRVNRKTQAYKVIKCQETWQVCATSHYKQLFQIGF